MENREDFFQDDEKGIDMTPKSDVIFKILFGNQKHSRLLIHLLNAIIRDESPITEVEIKQTELTPEFLGQRGVRLDILAKTEKGRLINVEIQKKNEHNMVERSLFHWSRVFSGQAFVSERYENLKKTICINIMAFRLFEDGRFWRRGVFSDSETQERLVDLLEIHFLELPKIKKMPADSPLMFWLEFINNPESEKIKNMYTLEAVYEEAKKAYSHAIADPAIQEMIRVREKAEMDYRSAMANARIKGHAEGHAEGRAEGRAEGEKKKAIETARNLLAMNLSVEQISQATGLSIEEVKSLMQ